MFVGGKDKEVIKFGHDIHSEVLFSNNSKMHECLIEALVVDVASLKPPPTLKLKLAAIWFQTEYPTLGKRARVALGGQVKSR